MGSFQNSPKLHQATWDCQKATSMEYRYFIKIVTPICYGVRVHTWIIKSILCATFIVFIQIHCQTNMISCQRKHIDINAIWTYVEYTTYKYYLFIVLWHINMTYIPVRMLWCGKHILWWNLTTCTQHMACICISPLSHFTSICIGN